jgi:hypothetical protein
MRKPDPFFATLNRLLGWNQHPRNGKVARLPEATRNQINRMLDDGMPYRAILEKLRESNPEGLTYALSEMNLSNWFHGGFQDWCCEEFERQLVSILNPNPSGLNRSNPQQSAAAKG